MFSTYSVLKKPITPMDYSTSATGSDNKQANKSHMRAHTLADAAKRPKTMSVNPILQVHLGKNTALRERKK
jgi:hypothetical protein